MVCRFIDGFYRRDVAAVRELAAPDLAVDLYSSGTLFRSEVTIMTGEENAIYDTLLKINQLADMAIAERGKKHEEEAPGGGAGELPSCTPKALPVRLLKKSADVAFKINPVNAPAYTAFARADANFQPMDPQLISVLTSKYWGRSERILTVSFMETTPADLRARIISHMNAWTNTGGISFVETSGTGQVRVSRSMDGYWSYLGTDVLLIPKNRPTMNLQGFAMSTSESEYKRVIRHETGHTLGCPHEHMRKALVARIDRRRPTTTSGGRRAGTRRR